MLFSALSRLFFSKITENPKKNYALYLPILLVNSNISFKKHLM